MKGWKRFLSQRQNWLAMVLVGGFVGLALAAPRLSPLPESGVDDPPAYFKVVEEVTLKIPQPPSEFARLGTTAARLDVFHTLVWGAREALRFGLTVTVVTAALGVLAGATSAYAGGWWNAVIMRAADAFLAFPAIAGVVMFQQVFSPGFSFWLTLSFTPFQEWLKALNPDPVLLALILFSWMPYARLINATVAQIKQADYVLAAQAQGAGAPRLIFRHLLPNALSPAIVLAARDVGGMVVLEAAFTFIGVGGRGPWGSLLVANRDWIAGPGGNLLAYWWVYLPITLALVLFGVGWNLLGDGLNTALNPRARR